MTRRGRRFCVSWKCVVAVVEKDVCGNRCGTKESHDKFLEIDAKKDDVLKLFRSYGRVANVRIPLEPMSKGHRGYAFVTMNSSSEAQACITALHGAEFGGSGLLVEVSKRKAPHAKTPGVYLGPRCESGSPDRGVSLESTGRRFSEGQTSSVHARSGGRTPVHLRQSGAP
ncbi:unnamed protein product [Polarella glacialis]|uniref:RRM domain-containing protein n=1 Tax=Polarella glacialis TaxID=89957 RepID=A0A813JTE1_POLGL|nr:unnamed protein product [Polarella glacialis]